MRRRTAHIGLVKNVYTMKTFKNGGCDAKGKEIENRKTLLEASDYTPH